MCVSRCHVAWGRSGNAEVISTRTSRRCWTAGTLPERCDGTQSRCFSTRWSSAWRPQMWRASRVSTSSTPDDVTVQSSLPPRNRSLSFLRCCHRSTSASPSKQICEIQKWMVERYKGRKSIWCYEYVWDEIEYRASRFPGTWLLSLVKFAPALLW